MKSTSDKMNILVVDDLPDKLMTMEVILAELGENVISARSGTDALRQVLENDFAVILLDVNMPDMDGFETATLIRNRKKSAHTPIIFVTAFADEMHTAQGYSLGAVDYILSPVVPQILRTKVRVFVDLFRMTQQVKRHADEHVSLAREQMARAAAEEATRRSAFLAEASKALATSLEPAETLRTLARLPVPFLADLGAVTLTEDSGQLWRSELAWVRAADGTIHSLSLTASAAPHDPLREAVERVLAQGRSEDLAGLDIPCPPHQDSEDKPPEGATRLRAAVILPLQARGRTLGALTLALGPSDRQFGPADRSLALEFASRAAIFLDNAFLYQSVQQADRHKNEFLSMLAHELRNPLAPIRNALHLLRLRGGEMPELHWAREVIDRQVNHLVRLVDDLLDVSRITQGKIRLQMAPVEVDAVVTQAIETSRPLIDTRKHQLNVNLPSQKLHVRGDATRLAQILANLLNNAAKYTDEGGRIWLTAQREGDDVVLSVRDTGVGIPAGMLSSIFELFTQVDRSLDRSQGGLGIGLTLVHRLVEMHGGSVRANSAGPNQGSEFSVRLPLLQESAAVPVHPNGRVVNGTDTVRGRILVVDDNVDAADSLAMLLQMAGHEVRTAHDGSAAIETACEFFPDVVLLDIGLPGMTGYEVARQLRSRSQQRELLLVALTGYGQDEDRQRSHDAGFDHHLTKPVDPNELLRVLGSVALQ
ncbi:MAG: response regulator [Gemmataceae bacterium]|nr:response regulator [Gemmataceae bacterium]